MTLPAWQHLVPLQDKQEDYEPQEEELLQFAEYLGIDPAREKHLMGLAREGLTAALPPFWQACEGPDGELYFRNRRTRQITDQNPLDELYREKVVQMRGLTQVDTIHEQSAVNESSGIMGSRLAGRQPQQRQFEHHITEESVYSQQSDEEDEAKTARRMAVAELRRRIECFVPSREKLLPFAANLQDIIEPTKAQKLADLRLQIQQRKSLLLQLKQQKHSLLFPDDLP